MFQRRGQVARRHPQDLDYYERGHPPRNYPQRQKRHHYPVHRDYGEFYPVEDRGYPLDQHHYRRHDYGDRPPMGLGPIQLDNIGYIAVLGCILLAVVHHSGIRNWDVRPSTISAPATVPPPSNYQIYTIDTEGNISPVD